MTAVITALRDIIRAEQEQANEDYQYCWITRPDNVTLEEQIDAYAGKNAWQAITATLATLGADDADAALNYLTTRCTAIEATPASEEGGEFYGTTDEPRLQLEMEASRYRFTIYHLRQLIRQEAARSR